MSVQVEKLENNMAKLTIEVAAEEFVAATAKAYHKNKIRFPYRASEKVKRHRHLSKNFMEQVFSMKMQQMI